MKRIKLGGRSELTEMRPMEAAIGWVYLPLHAIGMWMLMPIILDAFNFSEAQYNLFVYAVGYVVLSFTMANFLRTDFDVFWDNFRVSIQAIGVNIIWYYIAQYAVSLLLASVLPTIENPNTEAVTEAAISSGRTMMFVAAVLAPIVEEILFRGVVFGTIARKNKAVAYIVSTVLFSAYHLWIYVYLGADLLLMALYAVEYIPGSVMFAKTYDESGTIWAPILMHMLMNYVAVSAASML